MHEIENAIGEDNATRRGPPPCGCLIPREHFASRIERCQKPFSALGVNLRSRLYSGT
jgi:hypothetical protein